MNNLKKAVLKSKYKKLYLKIKTDFNDYNCGHKMLLNISSDYYNTCKEFNNTADKLSKIDINVPKFRYELS